MTLASVKMALRQIRYPFQIGLATPKNRDRVDLQKAVSRGNPQVRNANLAELFADFVRRHREWRMNDNDPLPFPLVRNGSNNDTQLAFVQAQNLLNRFL